MQNEKRDCDSDPFKDNEAKDDIDGGTLCWRSGTITVQGIGYPNGAVDD